MARAGKSWSVSFAYGTEKYSLFFGGIHKGACTNDVSTGGEPISDDRRGKLRDLCTINSDRGRGGQKSRKLG